MNSPRIVISIVLGSYNRLSFLKKAIRTTRRELEKHSIQSEIIVVDGGSTDGSISWLSKQKDIISIIQHNRGKWNGVEIEKRSWGYFMNLAFKCAAGKYVMMISDDCLVIPNSIKNGIDHFEARLKEGVKLGAVAFYWRNWPSDTDYFVGQTLGRKLFVNHGIYLNDVLRDINYIDEESYSFYHADGDLSLKIWDAGYVCEASPSSYIEHYADANTFVKKGNLEKQKMDWSTYVSRWRKYTDLDSYEGGWIYKSYNDPNSTYKLFTSLYIKDLFLVKPKRIFYYILDKVRNLK